MSSLLPPAVVGSLRALVRSQTLPDTCVVLTRVATDDGMGGERVTWQEGPPLPCRLSVADNRPSTGGVAAAEASVTDYRLACDPADVAALRPQDRVRVTRLGGAACDRAFEVVAPLGPKSWGVVANLRLVEIRG